MLEIYQGPLPVEEILSRWYQSQHNRNYGAFISFVGVVREENEIEALSFDIYEPMLRQWYEEWQEKAKAEGAILVMAHSRGDVPVHRSSYIAGVFSPRREVALRMIHDFVEDFKAHAPIWKYDVRRGERIYAAERSHRLPGSGLLA
ncbi:MAG: molybdenum cofactor biosynthesis protein MoaE [Campylobacterales bacterium]